MSEDLSLTVPPDLVRLLNSAAKTGEYSSAADALADAITLWARRHEDTAEDLAWLRASLSAAMNDPRPSLSMDEVKVHMKALRKNAKTRPNEAA